MSDVMLGFECPHGFVNNYKDCEHVNKPECAKCRDKAKLIGEMLKDCFIGKWISIKDRLPEEKDYHEFSECCNGAVLWWNGKTIGPGWYYTSTGAWANIEDLVVEGVTHWMPLPEPPKEG